MKGGGLGVGGALVLLFVFCVVVYLAATGGQGIPATGSLSWLPASDSQQAGSQIVNLQATKNALSLQIQGAQDEYAQARNREQAATAAIAATGTATDRQATAIAQATEIAVTEAALSAIATATQSQAQTLSALTVQQTQQALTSQKTADALLLGREALNSTATAQTFAQNVRNQERDATTGYTIRMGLLIIAVVAVVTIAFWLLKIKDDRNVAHGSIDPLTGRAAPMVAKGKLLVPDLAQTAVTDPRNPAQAPGQAQLDHNQRDHQVRAVTAMSRGNGRRASAPAAQQMPMGMPLPLADNQLQPGQTPKTGDATAPAPWNALSNWSPDTGVFPLGLTASGDPVQMDPEETPNLAIAAMTGIGKSRKITIPVVMSALASGVAVGVISEKPADFAIFRGQPNFYLIRGEADKLLETMRALLEEARRRIEVMDRLSQVDPSGTTYYRIKNPQLALGPLMMFVVDGLISFIYEADPATANSIWRATVSLASKCRAVGIMLVLTTTDPSYRMGRDWLAVRPNCGRVTLQLLDNRAYEVMLDTVPDRTLAGAQFVARFGGELIYGNAFYPEDPQIVQFLADHPVGAISPLNLPFANLSAPVDNAPLGAKAANLPEDTQPVKVPPRYTQPAETPETIQMAEKIFDLGLWETKTSKRQIAKHLGFVYAGNFYTDKLDRALAYLEKKYGPPGPATTATSATTTTSNPLPQAGD
jgi:hypothetical protein